MEEVGVVALCQSIGEDWPGMLGSLKEVCTKKWVKKAGLTALLDLAIWRGAGQKGEPFFSSKKDFQAAFNKRSALRESLLETWRVDTHTKRHAFVKSVKSKWKRLNPHTCRWSLWRSQGQVCCPFQFEEATFPKCCDFHSFHVGM